jgi:uncharacterized repeat protein (TIGR01451 family)
VTIRDTAGTLVVNVPANSVVDYVTQRGMQVPFDSTVRLTAPRNFWGLSAYNHSSAIGEWGHSWLATRFLTTDYTVAYAPGTQPFSITNLTWAGGTATATTSVPVQPLWGGGPLLVTLSGANPAGYNGVRVATVTGASTFTFPLANPGAPNPATGTISAVAGPCDNGGVNPPAYPCNAYNRDPLWISATMNNTRVLIDRDNDGFFDWMDTDSDGCPNDGPVGVTDPGCGPVPAVPAGCPALNAQRCVHVIHSPGGPAPNALRVWDYLDFDNAGTHVVSDKPVALSWGQDLDQGLGADPSPDSGYTVYPNLFIDPVLTLAKAPNTTSVPMAGGNVTYTLTVNSAGYVPVNNVSIQDLLPVGIPGTAYVAGSTVITYPDLSTATNDPTIATVGGRTQLTWALTPNTMQGSQTITVTYTINYPAAAGPRTLTNNAQATGTHGALNRVFTARASSIVTQTYITLVKTVVHDGQPEVGDTLTYGLTVSNTSTNETNVTITDPIPPGTTFVPGSITNGGPFVGVYDASQNAVVWTAAAFNNGVTANLSFQVTINAQTPAGTIIPNSALYQSTQTSTLNSNVVTATVVAPVLNRTKSATPAGPLHPNEIVTFTVTASNTGGASASNVTIIDPLGSSNTTYIAGTMSFSVNGAPFTTLTDAADADGGVLAGSTLTYVLASLPSGQDVRFRFQARVNLGTTGLFVANQASITSTQTGSDETNLVQISITGDATINGHVFLDLDGDGAQDPGEPDLANVTVNVTDRTGVVQAAVTDANGNYSVIVPSGAGNTTVDIDDADSDIPAGATRTGGPDPVNLVNLGAGSVTNNAAVGFWPFPLVVTKTSSAGGTAFPGQTITYSVTVNNTMGVLQTNVALNDGVPTGTTFVSATARVPTFRVTEYAITDNNPANICGGADFTGFTCNLDLNQNLVANYFAIVQGADGEDNDSSANTDEIYVSITADPFASGGAGGLANSGVANRLILTRGDNTAGGGDDWQGTVTVVECLGDCAASGFSLVTARRIVHTGGAPAVLAGNVGAGAGWGDLTRVQLIGGANGGGCDTTETSLNDIQTCHVRYFPTGTGGTSLINWTRQQGGGAGTFANANTTVYAIEWGAEWTVNRQRVQGVNGGTGINAAGEYNVSAAFAAPVARDNTWVYATGHTADNGIGNSAEGVAVTLGNGVTQNPFESTVAVGFEELTATNINKDFEVWALTHPKLRVDHRFKASGDAASVAFNQTVDYAAAATQRMSLFYNSSSNPNSGNHPRSIFSSRYVNGTTVELRRRRNNQTFAGWLQGIDFSRVDRPSGVALAAPPDVMTAGMGFTVLPNEQLTVVYTVTVDNPLAAGITQISNTGTVTTTQVPGGRAATVVDNVVRPALLIDPDNAGFATAGSTITFFHTVRNTGTVADSFTITGRNDLGWAVELIDPASGAVIATDGNGDGVWNGVGVTVNTGLLAVGASRNYRVRVTVPGGATVGAQATAVLQGASITSPFVGARATDEITVLGSGSFQFVDVLPDQSGTANPSSYVAYTHTVVNTSGASQRFDLSAVSTNGYTVGIHIDTNNDGVYTPGIDVPVVATGIIPNLQSQRVFVVVNVPAGTPAGTVDITQLRATQQGDITRYDTATDTTTVVAPTDLDLSGGGTRYVSQSDVAIFPGTLTNYGTTAQFFDMDVSVSSIFALDGLNHPTELWIDTNGPGGLPDGIIQVDPLLPNQDTLVATDSDGDGVWDTITAGWDTQTPGGGGANGQPEIQVAAATGATPGTLAYGLVKRIPGTQQIPQEYVSLRATSISSPAQADNITSTWIIAALTRASIRGVKVNAGGRVQFATGTQSGTYSFNVYEVPGPGAFDQRVLLTDEPLLSPSADSLTPILYDAHTRALTQPYILIEEQEVGGEVRWSGPFSITDARLREMFDRIEERLSDAGETWDPRGRWRRLRAGGAGRFAGERRTNWWRRGLVRGRTRLGAKVEVEQPGTVTVSLAQLQAAGLPASSPERLQLTHMGQAVPFTRSIDGTGAAWITFTAQALSTDFTGRNAYVFTVGQGAAPPWVALTRSETPAAPGVIRAQKNTFYEPHIAFGHDPWLWDVVYLGPPAWPYTPGMGTFDLPNLAPGLSGDIPVRIELVGGTEHVHHVEAYINGYSVGGATFSGAVWTTLSGQVPAAALLATGNELTLDYVPSVLGSGPPVDSAAVGLNFVEVVAPTAGVPASAAVRIAPYNATLPSFAGVQYLIVTHEQFRPQADRMAALKQAQGLKSVVVDIESVYDRLSSGIVEAAAVRALVQVARNASGGTLKYVLLIGDDTFDPQDFMGTGAVSFIPSLTGWDNAFGRVPSENRYADLDGDGTPEVAIGRLPAQTLAQATLMVDKVAAYAAPAFGAQSHLFAVDNSLASDAPFRADAESMAALVPNGGAAVWADVAPDINAARTSLQSAWQAGRFLTHYFGHGGVEQWADEVLLDVSDAPSLTTAKPTIVLQWACQSNWYQYLFGPSLGETLLLAGNGGAVASFGPAGITGPGPQRSLYEGFYQLLGGASPPQTLGELIRQSKASALARDPRTRPVVEEWNLLGDPALPMVPGGK